MLEQLAENSRLTAAIVTVCRRITVPLRSLFVGVPMCVLLLAGCGNRELPKTAAPVEVVSDTPEKIRSKTGVEMVLLPAGEFLMGDDAGEDDEKPAHRVQLGAFYIDTAEVTQASFQAMMGRNPSKSVGPQKPVERVSWYAAVQYCNMRSGREGLQPCYDLKTLKCDFAADGYRLPTEAEWEYACRAGTATRWSFGDNPAELAKYGWFKGNAGGTTHPVQEKQPNAWGLYDMQGNVAEWCNDFYSERYDASGPSKDPTGPTSGDERVLRGGSWSTDGESCRASARHSEPPGFADVCFGYEAYGFRCVRQASPAH
jgi:formylglycine-generating enzyme required for sulfatase activity